MSLSVNNLVGNLFPKTNYVSKQVPTDEILHYLIALKQSTGAITSWIEKKNLTSLLTRSVNQLSALDLCAILGRADVAEVLLKKKVSPSTPDSMGRTPLHYASLVHGESSDIFQCLKTALKSHQTADSILRGKDSDYLNLDMVLDRTLPAPTDLVFQYRKNGEIVKGTAQDFKQMTGRDYTKRILVTKEALLNDWLSPIEQYNEDLQEQLSKAYKKFKTEPSKVFLDQDPQIHQLGGYASQDIKTGEILAVFLGEQVGFALRGTTNQYHIGRTDCEKVQNEASIFNHGFPNAQPYGLFNTDGLTEFGVLVANEPIPKGAKICYNYGKKHDIVRSNFRSELRTDEFLKYIATHPNQHFQALQQEAKERQTTLAQIMSAEGKGQKLIYLFQDPYAYRQLLLTHKHDKKYLTNLLSLLRNEQFQSLVGLNMLTTLPVNVLCKKMIETSQLDELTFDQLLQISQL